MEAKKIYKESKSDTLAAFAQHDRLHLGGVVLVLWKTSCHLHIVRKQSTLSHNVIFFLPEHNILCKPNHFLSLTELTHYVSPGPI